MLDSAIKDVRGQIYSDEKSTLAPASSSPASQSISSASSAQPAVASLSTKNSLSQADTDIDKKGKTVVPITLPITNTQIINTGGEPIVVYRDPNSSYPAN